MCKTKLKCTLKVSFLDCLTLTFCDVIDDKLQEWACLTLYVRTFCITSSLADISVSRLKKCLSHVLIQSSVNSQRSYLHLKKKCRICLTVSANTPLTIIKFTHVLSHVDFIDMP